MTNVSGTPEKRARKKVLFDAAIAALEKNGWKVERIARSGKSSVRQITKAGKSHTVTIRTSQNTWIAFPRNKAGDGWRTLEGVDFVIAASVDNALEPRFAKIHMIEGDEMRARFDRAHEARMKANYSLPDGRGMWVSLYDTESADPVTHVGAGAGLKHLPIAPPVPLDAESFESADNAEETDTETEAPEVVETPMTIAEAKRRLAKSFGVNESDISITISS